MSDPGLTRKREAKGIELVIKGHVAPVNASQFMVESESRSDQKYTVRWDEKRWVCSCEDFKKHRRKCKHIYAVCYYLSLLDLQVGVRKIGGDEACCPRCGSSDAVIKDGLSESRSGLVQRHLCKKCNRGFTAKTGFEGMHGQSLAIVLSLDLYYRGLSLRQISEHLHSVYGIEVSHGTVYGWIKRYVNIVGKYLNRLTVKTSGRWHMDDTVVRVKGKYLTLWAILDSEFRFLIAKHISRGKGADEAYKLLDEGLKKSENVPREMVTDGAASYAKAIDKKFGDELKEPLIHVQASISTPLSNNKMERFYRTLKGRFKTISNFDSEETAETFLKGFTIFYNNIKPHRALNGETPAQAVSAAENKGRWVELIQEARKRQR